MGCPTLLISWNLQFLLLFIPSLLQTDFVGVCWAWSCAPRNPRDTWSSNTPLFTSPVKTRGLGVASALPPNGKSLETDVCRKATGKGAPGYPAQFHWRGVGSCKQLPLPTSYRNSWYGVRNKTAFTDFILCWGLGVASGVAARKIPLPSGMEIPGRERGSAPPACPRNQGL